MKTLTALVAILSLSAVACGFDSSGTGPADGVEQPTRWTYSVEYVDGRTMAVTRSESGYVGAGAVPLAIDGWQGVLVSSEEPDALGRATRALRIDGQAEPVGVATCGLDPKWSAAQSSFSVQGETHFAVVTLTCLAP